MPIDSAIASTLSVDAAAYHASRTGGGCSSASTYKIESQDGSKQFFVKTGHGSDAEQMFIGEHNSLNALSQAVPGLTPRSLGHGRLKDQSNASFLVTEYLDMSGARGASGVEADSLATKLAKLHTTPAPIPAGYNEPQFGFPVATCCGDTAQDNSFNSSWAEFYANCRLKFITKQSRQRNGQDHELDVLVERTCREVVDKLIGDEHLNDGKGVQPVVVHGDLWSGNAGKGRLAGMAHAEQVIYDPSSCYAHSEYELGIMKMFGGFGVAFLREYHELCPKTKPVSEYDDRVALYELYHHLNHFSLFGGGYRSGAVSIMRTLLQKYGKPKHET